MALEGPGGYRETAVLQPVGGTIRFSIGEPGCHASIWKIWATKNNSSVYVASRSTGSYLKASLHPTREGYKWWFQWTSEHMRADPQVPQVDKREIDHWPNPSEVGETGWASSFSILTRHEDIVHTLDKPDLPAKNVMWLSGPPKGYATCIQVVLARPKNHAVEISNGIPVGAIALANRKVAFLIESRHLVTDQQNREIERAVANVTQALPEGADQSRILSQESGQYRTLVWCDTPDGERQAWDVAIGVGDQP